jgi:Spy/CpxP family protein refolding chaperone
MFGMDSKAKGLVTAIALLVSVFMAGVLSAVAVVQLTRPAYETAQGEFRRGGPRDGRPPFRGGPGRRPDGPPGDFFVEMMTERLELSEEQRQQVADIVAHREQIAEEVMRSVRDRLRAVMDSIDAEIRSVLTPEQQEEFDRMQEEGRERLGRRFPGGAPGMKGSPPDPPR